MPAVLRPAMQAGNDEQLGVQEQAVEASLKRVRKVVEDGLLGRGGGMNQERTIFLRGGFFMGAWEAAKYCRRASGLGWSTKSAEPVEAGYLCWPRFFRSWVGSGIPHAENPDMCGVNLGMPSGSGIGGSQRRSG